MGSVDTDGKMIPVLAYWRGVQSSSRLHIPGQATKSCPFCCTSQLMSHYVPCHVPVNILTIRSL